MSFTFSTFLYLGGTTRWAALEAPDAQNTVLILPGWGEWIEKYRDAAEEWKKRGYKAVILEWRGQGLSSRFLDDPRKTWLPSADVLINDLDTFFSTHLANERNVLIYAHSMGAHIGLRWLLESPPRPNIKAAILSNLMQRIITKPVPFLAARALAAAATLAGHGQKYAIGQESFDQAAIPFEQNLLTRDAARYAAMIKDLREKPELKVGGVTYGWLEAMFRSAERLERDLQKNPQLPPTLFLASKDDLLVDSEAIGEVAGKIPGAATAWFENARHELLFETDGPRQRAWKEIDIFLKNRMS